MPAFERIENNLWQSHPKAQGPFTGLQGGAVAGLMVSELEQMAARLELGHAVSASVEFLRPTRSNPLRTDPEIVRHGRRVSFLSNRVFDRDNCTARATVCFVQPADMSAISVPDSEPCNPEALPILPPRKAVHGQPWMMDNFEVRQSQDGIIWFRYVDEIVDGMMPMARILGPADWTHGLGRPKSPRLADPNVNLNVVISRQPVGDQIGIRPNTTWMPTGIGIGDGELLDSHGPFGRVSMAVALMAFG